MAVILLYIKEALTDLRSYRFTILLLAVQKLLTKVITHVIEDILYSNQRVKQIGFRSVLWVTSRQ